MNESHVLDRQIEVGATKAPPFVAARNITKNFGGAQALKGVSLDIVAGRSSRARRGEWCRQIDPHPHPRRAGAARCGHDRGRRPAGLDRNSASGHRTRHELHPPGIGLHSRHDRAAEHHARNSEALALRHGRLARDRPRCRADRRACRDYRAARRQREGPVHGRKLAHQHLSRARSKGAADRHGRADRFACRQARASDLFAIVRDLSRIGRVGPLCLASAR